MHGDILLEQMLPHPKTNDGVTKAILTLCFNSNSMEVAWLHLHLSFPTLLESTLTWKLLLVALERRLFLPQPSPFIV